MDTTAFTNPTGDLVTLDTGEPAFVPGPLPDAVELDEPCWRALAVLAESVGRLKGMEAAVGESLNPAILEQALGRREAVHSSSIEGTVVSPQAMALYDTMPVTPSDRLDPANDLREVKNLREALLAGESLGRNGVFTTDDLRALHASLFEGVKSHRFPAGELRDGQVYLGVAKRFIPPPADRVPVLLEQWTDWCARTTGMDPSIRALLAHYQLEAIHPFFDGNGRVGRVVLALALARWHGLSRPWIAPSSAIERAKEAYIARLFDVSAGGDWLAYLAFGLDRLRLACDESFAIMRDLRDQARLWEETALDAGMKPRVRALLARLIANPVTDITDAAETMGCAYNTAKADLEKLESLGIVTSAERNNRKVFDAPSVFRIVHG